MDLKNLEIFKERLDKLKESAKVGVHHINAGTDIDCLIESPKFVK